MYFFNRWKRLTVAVSYILFRSSADGLNTSIKYEYKKKAYDRKVNIKYVEWTGSKGMLPFQAFHNRMPKREFEAWLRQPLPSEWNSRTDHDNSIAKESELIASNKERKEAKASNTLDPNEYLNIIYIDAHIIVVDKMSGVLSVPGPKRNPSTANLVHEYFGNEEDCVDSMVIHRLDMDTSGIIIYARSKHVLSIMHDAFRNKSEQNDDESISKQYEALVCGHVSVYEGEIEFPLVRDKLNPPFMKVYTGADEDEDLIEYNKDVMPLHKHKGYVKMVSKAPKDSLTLFRVKSYEYLDGNPDLPVTRLSLYPITGRTHQLRVVCAGIGHPIVGDSIYGVFGDGSRNGGFSEEKMSKTFHRRASFPLQVAIYNYVTNRADKSWELCLHARQLTISHPITRSPMMFSSDAPF
jgi:23S rRNA-/tRNA-specific pseudouridylate synthase